MLNIQVQYIPSDFHKLTSGKKTSPLRNQKATCIVIAKQRQRSEQQVKIREKQHVRAVSRSINELKILHDDY